MLLAVSRQPLGLAGICSPGPKIIPGPLLLVKQRVRRALLSLRGPSSRCPWYQCQGMGHVLPAPALSQKHSRSCPCSWSCWPLAWPVPYKGEGACAMLVTAPLSQEWLSPPPWSPKLEWSKPSAPFPCPGGGGCGSAGGLPGTLENLAPEASAVQGTQNKQKAHCRAWKASTARAGMRDGGTPEVWGAECDSRAVQGRVPCHLCCRFPNSKGARDEAAPPGDGNTVHGPMVPWPLWGSPCCLWDTTQGWRGRAGQPKDVLVSQPSPSNALSRICCPGRWWQVGTSLSSPSGTWLWHRPHRGHRRPPAPAPLGCSLRVHAKAASLPSFLL